MTDIANPSQHSIPWSLDKVSGFPCLKLALNRRTTVLLLWDLEEGQARVMPWKGLSSSSS